jgi:hypothetical protein
MMTTFPADVEPAIESELIDLSSVSFAALRDLDTPAFHGALRRAVKRAGQVRYTSMTNSQGGGERVD